MTTCSSSLRALCLGLALLASNVSATRTRRDWLPYDRFGPSEVYSGSRLSDYSKGPYEYDRGQEYVLALGAAAPPPPIGFPSETESYAESVDFGGRKIEPWNKRVFTDDERAIVFEGSLPGFDRNLGAYETEQSSSVLGGLYNVDPKPVLSKYLERELPVVTKTYETVADKSGLYGVDSKVVLGKYLESERPIVTKTYETVADKSDLYGVDSKVVLSKYIERENPIVTKKTEILTQPIVKNSYSIQPRPVIRPIVNVLPAPVIRRPINILPPPVVKKLYKIMPAPIVRKYFTPPPVVQKESPPIFNKFIKNIYVEQRPEQTHHQHPIVVVPPSPDSNVYNLIKVAAPAPEPVEVTTPAPTTPAPTTPAPTTPAPTTTPVPTTAAPVELARSLVKEEEAAAEEEEEAQQEEQKLQSVGKMVVVETVRRVIDVPAFDGPAPPATRSEETVVDADGTVHKFEKYIEYDEVPVTQQPALAVRTSHSKKQSSKSSYAAVHGVQQHASAARTAPSASTARLIQTARPVHDPAVFSAYPGPYKGSPFFSRFSDSSFDSPRFGKSPIEPESLGDVSAENAPFDSPQNLAEVMTPSVTKTSGATARALKEPVEPPMPEKAPQMMMSHVMSLKSPDTTAPVTASAEPPAAPTSSATVAPFSNASGQQA